MCMTTRVAAVVLCWLGLLLVVTLVAEPTREVVIWAPGQTRLLRVIEQAPVSVVEIPGRAVVVRGETPGYVKQLYTSGAWLVLPARRGVCGDRTNGRTGERNSDQKSPVRPVAREAQMPHDTGPGSDLHVSRIRV